MLTKPASLRCGVCFAPLASADEVHACDRVPLSTARTSTVTWEYLSEPDATDLKYATYVLLLPCPFCGRNAGPPTTKVRTDNGMFQTVVRCLDDIRCGAEVFCNGFSKREAHAGAVAKWQDRRPAHERPR